jgi:hypothetical protein
MTGERGTQTRCITSRQSSVTACCTARTARSKSTQIHHMFTISKMKGLLQILVCVRYRLYVQHLLDHPFIPKSGPPGKRILALPDATCDPDRLNWQMRGAVGLGGVAMLLVVGCRFCCIPVEEEIRHRCARY